LQCTWEGDVLESGFVIDFNSAKKIMEMWVSERFDHAVILHHEDPLADILRQNGQRVFLMWGNPTAENMARLIKDSINCQEVTLWETPTSFATV
jgi:6-pyruvoyl-tetrahydropterin synthase